MQLSCCAAAPAAARASTRAGWRSSAPAWSIPTSTASSATTRALQGFAFGMGVERMAMLKHGIPDLRALLRQRRALPGAVLRGGMRVPLSWLRDYVAWDGGAEELAELLSMTGTEVEGIDWVGRAARPREPGPVRGRQGGHARPASQRRQALAVPVEVGESHGGVRQIVCGADNFQAGDVVAVSLTGADAGERPQAQEGQPARRRSRRHDAQRAGAGLRGEEPRHRRAARRLAGRRAAERLPAGGRGRARDRGHAQPSRLLLHLRHRARGGGGGAAAAGAAAHSPSRPRRAPRRARRSPSRSPTPTCARATARASSAASRSASRRRGSRRASRTPACDPSTTSSTSPTTSCWPSASRCTPSTRAKIARRRAHRPAVAARRDDRHARRASSARLTARRPGHRRPRAAAGHRRRLRRRRRRGGRAHARSGARGGHLQRAQHHAHLT